MEHLVGCLPCKAEDLSVNPQHTHEKLGTSVQTCTQSTTATWCVFAESWRQEDSLSLLDDHFNSTSELQVQ